MQNSDMHPCSQVCMCSPTLSSGNVGVVMYGCMHMHAHALPADAVLGPCMLNSCHAGGVEDCASAGPLLGVHQVVSVDTDCQSITQS